MYKVNYFCVTRTTTKIDLILLAFERNVFMRFKINSFWLLFLFLKRVYDYVTVMFGFGVKARGKSAEIYNFNLINLHTNVKITCSTTKCLP